MVEPEQELPNPAGVCSGAQAPPISDGEYRLLRELVYEECGFNLGTEKRAFLESRIRRRMEQLGLSNAGDYYFLVKHSSRRRDELAAFLDSLMICETSFFRNSPQFTLLRERVLPDLVRRKEKAGSRMIRVWSAGCSTGQEPYSALMTMLEAVPEPDSWSLRVYASDLSFTALERARGGTYSRDQLKGVDAALLAKYFEPGEGSLVISRSVKRRVVFRHENLKQDGGLRDLDIIFCRNVMIYFDAKEQKRLVNKFADCLTPGGYLFVGHAESLQGVSDRFSMIHSNKGIAYRLEQ
ncbi:MAG TPA: protein-glutamate O-methyltransferase CheR [Blastocatellia bacterium]|jgi:chemotaxis protein methyltransferase CheR|nr:protein-glutamate O-methyltransferase CheR [Blastocatellia bacterium]